MASQVLSFYVSCYFDHYCLNKSLTLICPSCNFPSFLNNGFIVCRLTDENIYNSLALDYNCDDNDTNMITDSSFKPDPNVTSTLKCNNKNIKYIYFLKLKIM